jgi:hypothetical protein
MNKTSWARHAALGLGLALAALLSSCGGGGGGGDGGGAAGTGTGGGELQVSFNTANLSFSQTEGLPDANATKVISASASGGDGKERIYVGATIDGQGIQPAVPVEVNVDARTARITVQADAALPPGTYNSRLTLLACRDAACNLHVRGSPFTVNVTTTIAARLKASSSSVALAAPELSVSEVQALAVTAAQGTDATPEVVYPPGQTSGWLRVTAEPAGFRLRAESGALRPGTFTAKLLLRVPDSRQDLEIPVSFNVTAGLVVQAALNLRITSTSPASASQGEIPVLPVPGVTVATWAAAANVPWLVIDTASGAPGNPVRWHIDPARFASLANQQVQEGMLTIVGAGLSAQTVAVTLNKDVAEILAVDRLAVLAGETGEVLLYGANFDQLASPLQNLSITGASADSAQRLSPQVIRVTVPALAAGDRAVTLTTASGLPTRGASLQVLASRPHGYQAITTEGSKAGSLWDAASQTLFVVNRALGSVMGFRLGGTVAAPTSTIITRSIPNLRNIGLGRDGSLLALVSPDTLLTLSTLDLSTLRTRSTGAAAGQVMESLPLAVTGEDTLWYASSQGYLATYDLVRDQLKKVMSGTSGGYSFYMGPWAGVSANGRRMLMPQSGSISPQPPMLRRDALDGLLVAFPNSAPLGFFTRYSSDRRGARWLLEGQAVYDFDLGIEGRTTAPADWFGVQSAMSRDGTRAYVYTLHNNAIGTYTEPSPIIHLPRIYVFDTSTPLTTTLAYPVLGYIELADYPACRATQGPTSCEPYVSSMQLSSDDRTLMVVGDRRLVVAPVPDNLRGGVPALQSPQMSVLPSPRP